MRMFCGFSCVVLDVYALLVGLWVLISFLFSCGVGRARVRAARLRGPEYTKTRPFHPKQRGRTGAGRALFQLSLRGALGPDRLLVQVDQAGQMLVASLGGLLVLGEQLLGALGEGQSQASVRGLGRQ